MRVSQIMTHIHATSTVSGLYHTGISLHMFSALFYKNYLNTTKMFGVGCRQGRKFLVESGGGDENFPQNIFGLLLEPKYSIYLKLGYLWSPSRDFWH